MCFMHNKYFIAKGARTFGDKIHFLDSSLMYILQRKCVSSLIEQFIVLLSSRYYVIDWHMI